jgi:dihydrofolate reductase
MMNSYIKIVFSNTIKSATWNNTKLVKGNPLYEIKKLKKRPGRNIIVYGSGKLVDTLIKSDLVDEYQLWLHPVILGKGIPLFNDLKDKRPMTMVGNKTFASGVVILHYLAIKTAFPLYQVQK